ncbi:MAG: peptidylprolyl isomerase [Gammaproteobacteria bacterium]|nr:peptidylprolyl isomerase [Gammaproteobacteria bacterium]MDH5631248.1 peptidylprolyl isomerase [Gammaproteobacteria bacterium]
MKIENDSVVEFYYKLYETGQDLIEQSDDKMPMHYLHGHGNILAALESQIQGHEAGDSFTVNLAAKDAYGEYQSNMEQRVPIKHLAGQSKKWKKGMIAVVQTEQGRRQVTIVKAGKFMADVDFNHPFAGKDLTFEIDIESVREATAEEIAHGHVHAGGHCH